MSDRDAGWFIGEATDYLEGRTFGDFVLEIGFGGILFAIFSNVIEGIDAIGGLLIAPIVAFVDGFVRLLDGIFWGWVDMLDQATEVSIAAQVDTSWAMLGPFQPLVILGIIMVSIYMLLWFLDTIGIGPGAVPLLGRVRSRFR